MPAAALSTTLAPRYYGAADYRSQTRRDPFSRGRSRAAGRINDARRDTRPTFRPAPGLIISVSIVISRARKSARAAPYDLRRPTLARARHDLLAAWRRKINVMNASDAKDASNNSFFALAHAR